MHSLPVCLGAALKSHDTTDDKDDVTARNYKSYFHDQIRWVWSMAVNRPQEFKGSTFDNIVKWISDLLKTSV